MECLAQLLDRNGVIIERARREGRSLNRIERSIILTVREKAIRAGYAKSINPFEVWGERNREAVFEKVTVEFAFAYFDDMGFDEGYTPQANFIIRASNHPALVVGGHVSAEQIQAVGLTIPKIPTYEQWVKNGRVCVRK